MNTEKLFRLAKEKGISDLQIITDSHEALSLKMYNGRLEQNETSMVTGCQISGLVSEKKATYSLENMDMDEEEIISAIYDIASHMNGDEVFEIFAGSASYPEVKEVVSDFHEVSFAKKVEFLSSVERMIHEKDARVVQIPELEYEESTSSRSIVNSRGLNIQKKNDTCVLAVELVASNGRQSQVGFQVQLKNHMAELDAEKLVDDAIKEAVGMFDAEPCESGEYPIIIENEAMISLLGAFSSMFGGEAHLKKISPIQGKLGEKIFSEKITIKDMPLKEDAVTKQPFDDECVACFNKTVVDAGVFTTMLHDLKTAKAFASESTGSSFNGGISGCNLFIEAGSKTKDELIASIDRGILLTGFDGLHAGLNPISADMSLKTMGYFIEDGKIVRPVTLIIMAGNFLQMMSDVEEVGSDLKISYRGIGSPSIKFGKASISGK